MQAGKFRTGLLGLGLALMAGPAILKADLIVSDFSSNSVLRYSESTGAFLGTLVNSGSGGLSGASGVAFGPNNDLFVASRNTGKVLRYNASTGAFLNEFITGLTDQPTDLAIGPDGGLYVAINAFDGGVRRYDAATGAFLDVFTSGNPIPVNQALYIDFGAGDLGLSTNTDRVFRFNGTTGAFESSFVADTPRGVAYGADSNLYAAQNISSNVIRRLSGTGTPEVFVPSGSGGLANPRDIGFSNGFLLVGESDRVLRFDAASGAFADILVGSGSGGLTDGRYFVVGAPVPEPSTLSFAAAGLVLLLYRRRNRVQPGSVK